MYRSSIPVVIAAMAITIPFAAACNRNDAPTALPVAQNDAALDGTGYGVFGTSTLRRGRAHQSCTDSHYRDFDFWLGDWNVVAADGSITGATNRIVRELEGCALIENWTAANGSRGRSLNAFDQTDGRWHQMWVAPNGFAPLRISGVKKDGVLEMAGVRASPFGFSVIDTIRWQAISPDIVNQSGSKDIPGFSHSQFSIDYHRTDDFQPATELIAADCQPGGSAAENRLADFMTGSWRVETEHGLPIAESNIESDLSGCLFVERVEGSLGFESVAFFHYDAVTDMWTRGTMDNLGNRLEMTGPVDHAGGPIVLTGTKHGLFGRSVLVRLTIQSVSASEMRQTLQTSLNGGEKWSRGVTLVFDK
jgi:hypothetical protein